MLSKEENELLTRVGPGTMMGDVMRQYWLPFLYSWEIPADGPPLRVRLLGEDLLAFRDSAGAIGLLAERCAHRGAALFFGRNEECGLRCVYHGWKYDTQGRCIDMPNEPAESSFKERILLQAYQARERGGVVFAYLGPKQSDPPALPDLEWTLLPEAQVHHGYKAVLECNWMQSLEGDLDSAHLFILHGRLRADDQGAMGVWHPDRSPRLEIQETGYGLMYGARRDEPDGRVYWRTSQYLFPVHTIFPASPDGTVPCHIWVPIDDEHTLAWDVRWHPTREMPNHQMTHLSPELAGMGPMKPEQKGRFFADWWPEIDQWSDFAIDREIQRTQTYTGIPTIRLQDAAVTTSMGAIFDRSQERLGTTDAMIVRSRQRLLQAARELRESSIPPPGADRPELFRVRSCSAVLPAGVDWRVALDDWHRARTNELMVEQTAEAGR
ncbi:MAG: aromatic ring-hydroxylating dioxygenase subunit alpha [Chloroflexi bacterium]|nr:aromatic ring-hydroxylating dioxygenase subunit alpha [Chloroflexota bacterium]